MSIFRNHLSCRRQINLIFKIGRISFFTCASASSISSSQSISDCTDLFASFLFFFCRVRISHALSGLTMSRFSDFVFSEYFMTQYLLGQGSDAAEQLERNSGNRWLWKRCTCCKYSNAGLHAFLLNSFNTEKLHHPYGSFLYSPADFDLRNLVRYNEKDLFSALRVFSEVIFQSGSISRPPPLFFFKTAIRTFKVNYIKCCLRTHKNPYQLDLDLLILHITFLMSHLVIFNILTEVIYIIVA